MSLLKRHLDWRQRNVVVVDAADGGFHVRRGRSTCEVPWSSIDTVTAFKRDLLTIDCLCLVIRFDGTSVELDEQAKGFGAWLAMLETRLGIAPEWRLNVLFPAFNASTTEIYRRGHSSVALGNTA